MAPGQPTIDPELLLAQTAWVRSLARSLAIDAAGADDVAQEAFLAALQAPPSDASDALRLRAWLARVVTNLSHLRTRRNARRRVREEWVARPERTSSAAETVERASRLRLVVDAVMDLDEPYRSTVLLRYFDGLTTAEVADQMGVTSENVRKRLSRALQRLRRDLDDAHGGDGRSWLAALAPLLAPSRVEPLAIPFAGALGPLVAAAGVAGALVLAAAVADDPAPPGRPVSVELALAPVPLGPPIEEARDARRAIDPASASTRPPAPGSAQRWLAVGTLELLPEEERPATPEEPQPPSAPAAVPGRAFALDGSPLAGVALCSADDPAHVLATTAFDGGFALTAAQGARIVPASDAGWAAVRAPVLSGSEALFLVAAPAVDVAGRVVDAYGAPLADAQVELVIGDAALVAVPEPLERTVAARRSARSDALGTFRWSAVPTGPGIDLRVRLAGHAQLRVPVPAGAPGTTVEVELALDASETSARMLRGFVVHACGAPAPGARVRLGPYEARADGTGAFALAYDELPETATLVASLEGFEAARMAGVGAWNGPGAGAAGLELVLGAASHRIDGRVVGADGTPRAGWSVVAVADERSEESRLAAATATTDEDGHFALEGLGSRSHVVHAFDPESLVLVSSEPVDPPALAREGVVITVPREPLRSVAGRVVARGGIALPGATVRAALAVPGPDELTWRYGAETCTDADGRFVLAGIPREHVVLEVRHGAAATTVTEPGVLAQDWVRIEVPRTGFVRVVGGDADEVRALDGAGRLLRLGGPSGAELRAELYDGRSPLLRTSEDVEELVFLREGRIVGRRGVALAPGARLDVGGASAP